MRGREVFERACIAAVDGESLPQVVRLVRHANSMWTGHFRLSGEIELPDGRRVVFNRRIAVKASEQIGRKPARATA